MQGLRDRDGLFVGADIGFTTSPLCLLFLVRGRRQPVLRKECAEGGCQRILHSRSLIEHCWT